MAYDEATRALLERIHNASSGRSESPMDIDSLRRSFEKFRWLIQSGDVAIRRKDLLCPGPDVDIPIRLLVPEKQICGVIVYCHGGGWTLGSLDLFEPLCSHLAVATRCIVAMVGYRKAPEFPYPAALDDVSNALDYMTSTEKILPKDTPLIIGGDSAGGNLAAAITLRERTSGRHRIAAQFLLYPVLDADFERPSYLDEENQAMLPSKQMAEFWNYYAPDVNLRRIPEISPLCAGDFRELPPAVIITAEHDVLRDEGDEYATRLRQAGVPVFHKTFAGQVHGFAMLVGLLPGSRKAIDYTAVSLQSLLATSGT